VEYLHVEEVFAAVLELILSLVLALALAFKEVELCHIRRDILRTLRKRFEGRKKLVLVG
jgi:hypothetical protein